MMKHNLFIGMILFCFFCTKVSAQTDSKQKDTVSIEHLRGHSGLDPIIIHSKIVLNSYINDPKGPSGIITNTAGLALGIQRWSMGLDYSYVSKMVGAPGDGFQSAAGDIKFSLSNKIYGKGKHSIAITGGLTFPTGKMGYGSQYLLLTPILTYSYALKPSVILALQPQYSFHLMKDPLYPEVSLLTIRALFAKFTRNGYVFGLETKPTMNFAANNFVIFISPFVSRSLGAGFNIMFLCDIPANSLAIDRGPTFQFGINRNF